jgi:hypothetical protein
MSNTYKWPLKDSYGFPAPALIGLYSPRPRSGKSTTANILKRDYNYAIKPLAGPLKRMIRSFLLESGFDYSEASEYMTDKKEEMLPGNWDRPLTARYMMQTLGTEWGRECLGENVWIRVWEKSLELENNFGVVADDVRFLNEAEMIRNKGGEIWCVVREVHSIEDTLKHASEGGLDNFAFDKYIFNTSTIDHLENNVRCAVSGKGFNNDRILKAYGPELQLIDMIDWIQNTKGCEANPIPPELDSSNEKIDV